MRRYPLAVWTFAFAGPAFAQPVPPPANAQEIVVQGERDRDRQLRDFVGALTPTPRHPYDGQIGRFEWSVCPVVFGLGKAQNEAIAARIRQVGAAIGAELDKQPCVGNSLVIVADDKDATFAWMKRKLPGYFVNSAGRRLVIRQDKSHAIGWHVTDLLNADGTQATVTPNGVYIVKALYLSHLQAASRPHFLGSVLIVDRAALRGLTTTEFGDYAAMRTFAQIDPSGLKGQSAPTILTVLDASMNAAVPLTLTEWDLAFLRGLYGARVNQYAVTERGEIGRSMRKQLSRPGE
jgi:hypothetical protein